MRGFRGDDEEGVDESTAVVEISEIDGATGGSEMTEHHTGDPLTGIAGLRVGDEAAEEQRRPLGHPMQHWSQAIE